MPAAARSQVKVMIPVEPGHNNSPYEEIDAYVERERRRLKMPGISLAIVEGEQIVHMRGFGQAHPGGEPPTSRIKFLIGSLTKSFTALAVMQLVEAGKLELDAPVRNYLPWFRVADPQASAEMTVRHLLTHSSGLPNSAGEFILNDFDDYPDAVKRKARELTTQMLTSPVGSVFDYSNLNYMLLGLVVEVTSGVEFADYIQEHVLGPLGMRHSAITQSKVRQEGQATGYRYWFGTPVAAPDIPIPKCGLAGGGLESTAEDLACFMIVQLNGGRYGTVQILSPEGIAEMHRGAIDIGMESLPAALRLVRPLVEDLSVDQYGMGWFVSTLGQAKLVWHGGTLPNFGAYMALLPGQKRGLVLLFNGCHYWMNPVLAEFGTGAAAILAGEQPPSTRFLRTIPWLLRGQLLIPILMIADAATTLRWLRRRRRDPFIRPRGLPSTPLHLLLSMIPNLLTLACLKSTLGKRRSYIKLYMPDYWLIALICGSFGMVWGILRTWLLFGMLRRPSPPATGLSEGNPADGRTTG